MRLSLWLKEIKFNSFCLERKFKRFIYDYSVRCGLSSPIFPSNIQADKWHDEIHKDLKS